MSNNFVAFISGVALAVAIINGYVNNQRSFHAQNLIIDVQKSIQTYLDGQVALDQSMATLVDKQTQTESNVNNIAKYLIQSEKVAKEAADAKGKTK